MKRNRFIIKLRSNDPGEYIYRTVSGVLVRPLARTPVTPNQITIARMVVMAAAMYALSRGTYAYLVLAAGCVIMWDIMDHMDGDLATLKGKSSQFGAWTEMVADAIFGRTDGLLGFAAALGVYRRTGSLLPIYLIIAAMVSSQVFLISGFIEKTSRTIREDGWKKAMRSDKEQRLPGRLFYFFHYNDCELLALSAVLFLPLHRYLGIDSILIFLGLMAALRTVSWIAVLRYQYAWLKGK